MATDLYIPKSKLDNPPLEIRTLGDRVLRQETKNVASINDETRKLARQMLQTMYSADGIGLAAPQVAVNKRVIVIDIEPENTATPPMILVNPTIKRVSRELALGQEGCLSIPNVFADVCRPAHVVATYRDLSGKPMTVEASGLLARAIQHEYDHLEGILFVDRVENQLALATELKEHGFSMRDVQNRI